MNDEMTIIEIIRASKNSDEAAELAVEFLEAAISLLNDSAPEDTK